MADAPQAPTEQQLADAKAASDAEMAKWEGDFKEDDLTVKYKRDDKNDENNTNSDGQDTSSTDSEDESTEGEDASDEEEVETYSEPEPVVTMQDPGEYMPADYSFEATLADGKSVTVKSPEEAEKLAEDPDNFETPKQLMDFIRKSTSMTSKLERDEEKHTEAKAKYDEQQATHAQQIETVNGYFKEFNYLVSKGLLPEVPKKYQTANWQDPEVAKQPEVKAHTAVLNYMAKENTERAKAGVPVLGSVIDAFNAMQNDPANKEASDEKAKEAADKKAADVARKAAGARVAGSSPASQGSYVPKGIAVGKVMSQRSAAIWDD